MSMQEILLFLLLAASLVSLGVGFILLILQPRSRRREAATLALHRGKRPYEEVRLWREEEGGPLVVEVGGQTYYHMSDVQSRAVRRQLVALAADLIHFTGLLPSVEQPLPETGEWRESLRQAIKVQPPPPPPAEAPALEEPISPDLPKHRLFELLERPRNLPEKPPGEPSFVDEIERIIQRRLLEGPRWMDKEVHVRASPDGGIQILVDDKVYASPQEVPDEWVRKLIEDSVKEWEKMP